MGEAVGKGYIPVTFDRKAIGHELSTSVEGAASDSQGAVRSAFGKLASLAAGAFAAREVFSFAKDAVAQARESNQIAAQTEAVIKSTGAAAGLTARQYSDLANAISAKTGIDDEEIQKGENLLSTFTNIRNIVGQGNDIFTQATQIAVDMGKALGGDASSNAIQLGKALNDPIAGISALTRVGVTFTQQQKDQIKAMVAAGDTVGAQKVILAELNKEFGGSAEATATAGAKFSVFWGNIKEKVGNLIIPLLDRLATWAMTTLPRAFGVLEAAGKRVFGQIAMFWHTLSTGFTKDEGTPIERVALVLRNRVLPIVRQVVDFVRDHWRPVLAAAAVAFGLWFAPITTIVAALVYAYIRFERFRSIVNTTVAWLVKNVPPAFAAVRTAISSAVTWIDQNVVPVVRRVVGYIVDQFSHLVAAVKERWDAISEAIGHVIIFVRDVIGVALLVIYEVWKHTHDQIMQVVRVVWDQIRSGIETAVRIVRDIIDVVLSLINGDWGQAWDAIKDLVGAAWDFITNLVGNALSILGQVVSAGMVLLGDLVKLAWDGIVALAGAAWSGIKDAVVSGVGNLVGYIAGLPGLFKLAALHLWDWLWDGLKAAINLVVGGLNSFIGLINKFQIHVHASLGPLPDLNIDWGGLGIPEIPKLHQGGIVPGRRGEDVLALLQAGERVIPASRASSSGGGDTIIVHNPVPEPASVSVARELRWKQTLGAWQAA